MANLVKQLREAATNISAEYENDYGIDIAEAVLMLNAADRIAELEGQVSVGIETHVEDRKRIAELEAKNMDAAVAYGKQLDRIAELDEAGKALLDSNTRLINQNSELAKSRLNITVSKVEMDFGGEGVVVHPNAIAQMERLVEQLEAMVRDMMDEDECVLDHNGHCQQHYWFNDGECPDARAKAYFNTRTEVPV